MTDDRERELLQRNTELLERARAAEAKPAPVAPGFVRIDIGNGCGVLVTELALRACGWIPSGGTILGDCVRDLNAARAEVERLKSLFADQDFGLAAAVAERDQARRDLKLTRDGWANDSKHLHAEIDRLTADLANAMQTIETAAADFDSLALFNAQLEVELADLAEAYRLLQQSQSKTTTCAECGEEIYVDRCACDRAEGAGQ